MNKTSSGTFHYLYSHSGLYITHIHDKAEQIWALLLLCAVCTASMPGEFIRCIITYPPRSLCRQSERSTFTHLSLPGRKNARFLCRKSWLRKPSRVKSMTYKIDTCRYPARGLASLGYGKEWLTQYQDNVAEWNIKSRSMLMTWSLMG